MGISSETRDKFNFRKAPKAPIMPACRNCKHFTYDASEREGMRGAYTEKRGTRCTFHITTITSNILCDAHEFRHSDRRDV